MSAHEYQQEQELGVVPGAVLSALVLAAAAGLSAHLFSGFGSRRWRSSFLGLLLLLLCATQLVYLLQAALHVPTYPYRYDSSLLRRDCLSSGKGGKRARSSEQAFDRNPCFNYSYSDAVSNTTDSEQYVPYTRDCHGGFSGTCSLREPCTPCDRDSLHLWGAGRCRTCTAQFRGDCNFVPGVGPYCRESPDSKVVVPCTRCCTEGAVLIVNDTCY
jgi:hypothetical protein